MSKNISKKVSGFTLIEMVVVIVVMGILTVSAAPIFSQGLTASRLTVENLQSMAKLRYAVERIAREIRQINHNGAAYDITAMTASNLVFVKNETVAITVTINYSGSTISLGYSSPVVSATLSDEVSAMSFAYFDAAGAVTVSATDIAFIELTATLLNPITGGSFRQRTRVALRDQS